MPNVGRPSKNCEKCRTRRVKCTLERPECSRCVRLGVRCPGYRDEQSLIFRHEDLNTLSGSSAIKDRRRSRVEDTSDRESSSDSTTPFDTLPRPYTSSDWTFQGLRLNEMDPLIFENLRPSRLSPWPINEWMSIAVPLVLALFSFEYQDVRHFRNLEILPSLLSSCSERSPVMKCCEALGIAFLANRFVSVEASILRDQTYGRALAAVNTLLRNAESCLQDEAPISVWLLSLYEVITGYQSSTDHHSTVTWSIHTRGQIELLRLRGEQQLQTPNGRGIFWLLTMSTHMGHQLTGDPYPSFLQDWLSTSQDTLQDSDHGFYALNRFAFDLSSLSRRIREAFTSTTGVLGTITALWTEVLAFQLTLDKALDHHPTNETISLENLLMSNLYRTFYTKTLQIMFELVQSIQVPQNDNDSDTNTIQLHAITQQIKTTIHTLAVATLSTTHILWAGTGSDGALTSSLLGTEITYERPVCWVDILMLLWPLRTLRGCKESLDDASGEYVELMLRRMSEVFCIWQAVAP